MFTSAMLYFYMFCGMYNILPATCFSYIASGESQRLPLTSFQLRASRYLSSPVTSSQRTCCVEVQPLQVVRRDNFVQQEYEDQLYQELLVSNKKLLIALHSLRSGVPKDTRKTTTPEFPSRRRSLMSGTPPPYIVEDEVTAKDEVTGKDEVTTKDDVTEPNRASDQKAYECSIIECEPQQNNTGPVCACNYKTGNTVTFKNECDIIKHNCRFDTGFKTILNEVCPWQFESRSGAVDSETGSLTITYDNPRYYN